MKKGIIILLTAILFLASISADSLSIEKIDKGSVVISQLNNPAVFDFLIKNNGISQDFQIYSLIGVSLGPKGAFYLPTGFSNITVTAFPTRDMRKNPGFFTFEYQIRGYADGNITKDKLLIKIVNLEDAIMINPVNYVPGDEVAIIEIKNLENTHLKDLDIKFKSALFEQQKRINLEPYESIDLKIAVDSSKIVNLESGQYVVVSEVDYGLGRVKIESNINYLEKEGVLVSNNHSGFILKRETISKKNIGNTVVVARIETEKNIISRLFTISSLEASNTDRSLLGVKYSWLKELKPGETLEVTVTTNYTFPFIILVLIVLVAVFAKMYYSTSMVLTKRATFVKTRGGEFALRVTLRVKAKKTMDNVQIIDRIPHGTQLYDKMGSKPDKIDPSTRRMIWNMNRLNAGEERVYSYIIYSKLKIFGKFELPSATAIYESGDKSHEVFSNKTYFMNESVSNED